MNERALGAIFTHDDDVHFNNREPVGAPWSDDPDENPELAVDDDDGFGPENTFVRTPRVGDAWTFAVHYWNKLTDGDARTTARLRVYARSELVLDESFELLDDEQLWVVSRLRWTVDEPEIIDVDALADQPRPF